MVSSPPSTPVIQFNISRCRKHLNRTNQTRVWTLMRTSPRLAHLTLFCSLRFTTVFILDRRACLLNRRCKDSQGELTSNCTIVHILVSFPLYTCPDVPTRLYEYRIPRPTPIFAQLVSLLMFTPLITLISNSCCLMLTFHTNIIRLHPLYCVEKMLQ